MKGNNSNPIIIFGTGRSGTTVFSEALFRHRKIAYLSNYLERYPKYQFLNLVRYLFDNQLYRIFGLKRQLYGVSLFNKIIFKPSEAYSIWNFLTEDKVDFSRGFLYKNSPDEITQEKVRHYFDKLKKIQSKRRIGFKVTGPSRLHYLHQLFPDAYFIRIKRKAIPTLASFLKVNFWKTRGLKELWWNDIYTKDELKVAANLKSNPVMHTAFQLHKILEVTEKEISELHLNLLEIDYEEFSLQPELIIENTLNWLGLSHDKDCYNYLQSHKIVNRNMPDTSYFNESTLVELKHQFNIK